MVNLVSAGAAFQSGRACVAFKKPEWPLYRPSTSGSEGFQSWIGSCCICITVTFVMENLNKKKTLSTSNITHNLFEVKGLFGWIQRELYRNARFRHSLRTVHCMEKLIVPSGRRCLHKSWSLFSGEDSIRSKKVKAAWKGRENGQQLI